MFVSLSVVSFCSFDDRRTPKFKTSKKCSGIPTAENKTAEPRPNVVLGTGAPKPERYYLVTMWSHGIRPDPTVFFYLKPFPSDNG